MEPMLPTDEDTNAYFDRVVLYMQDYLGYSEKEASKLVHEYYLFFTDEESCRSIGLSVLDDDDFFHEGAGDIALRVHYYMKLKENPDPSAYVWWRKDFYKKLKDT